MRVICAGHTILNLAAAESVERQVSERRALACSARAKDDAEKGGLKSSKKKKAGFKA